MLRLSRILLGSSLLFCLTLALSAANKTGADDAIQRAEQEGHKCGFVERMQRDLPRILMGEQIQMRPDLTFTYLSPADQFAVHYDTDGINAVSTEDDNNNGIPDFVEAVGFYFDEAYRVEVEEMGYPKPPTDGTDGGSEHYDVYLLDLGRSRVYGYTAFDRPAGTGRVISHIVIDNNFSPLDSAGTSRAYFTTGIDAVKITAAHEYHHAIQVGGYGQFGSEPMFFEMTSTWMEYRLYPDIPDYFQYLPSLMSGLETHTFGDAGDATSGYRYGIAGQFFYNRYGDELIKRMWELRRSASVSRFHKALDSALEERGSDLATEWCEFGTWLYHTGNRAVAGRYFDEAPRFPRPAFNPATEYSQPSVTLSGTLRPLETRFVQIVLPGADFDAVPDTIDIGLVNRDVAAAIRGQQVQREYTIICTEGQQSDHARRINGTEYFLELQQPEGNLCEILYVRSRYADIDIAYPNPFRPEIDGSLNLPVPAAAREDYVFVTIHNAAMEVVYSAEVEAAFVDGNRVALWNGMASNGEPVSQGVYLYVVGSGDEYTRGKFAIISAQ